MILRFSDLAVSISYALYLSTAGRLGSVERRVICILRVLIDCKLLTV